MSSLEKLRSDAMRGKWEEVLKTYKKESPLRTENITVMGDTVLHLAVSGGKARVVEKMVDLLVDEEKKRTLNNVVVTVDGDGEVSRNVNIILGAENDKKNTPLHLAVKRGLGQIKKTAKRVNLKMCKKIGGADPSLIARRNSMGETPFFLAALYGRKQAFLWLHYLYVKNCAVSSADFVHYCIRDNDDTILHCAIREEHFGVAIEIIHLYKDHMKEMMRRNRDGLSPLHVLAAKHSAFKTTALLKMVEYLNVTHTINGCGLFVWNFKGLWTVKEKDHATTFEELLQEENKKRFLFKLERNCGLQLLLIFLRGLLVAVKGLLVPILIVLFSGAVYQRWLHNIPQMKKRHTGWRQIMTELLQHASDEDMSQIISRNVSERLSMSLQTTEDNERESRATPTFGTITIETPLMIAVKNGVVDIVEKILELFPLTIKDVNADGKNIFLLAAEYRQTEVFRFLCKQQWLTESLSGQVDKDGNNALHLAAGLGVIESDWLNPGEALSLVKENAWFQVVKAAMPCDLWRSYNRKMETPGDIFKESYKELRKSEGEWVAKTSQACSVVSTLVVSVAFATRTSVPGGYEGDNGYATLRNKSQAFKTFRESSFLALFFSLISTICFLSIVASQSAHSLGYVPTKFYYGIYSMFGSIVCLWISFCAADFFILHDDPQKLHKALPTYIWLTCGVTLMVFLQLPIFLGPRLSGLLRNPLLRNPLLRIPGPSRKATRLIEYRKTKDNENGTVLNHQN